MKVVDAFGRAKEPHMEAISIRSPAFGTDTAFEVTAAVDKQLQWEADPTKRA